MTTYTYTFGLSIREYVLNEETWEVTYYTGYFQRRQWVGGHGGQYITPRTMERRPSWGYTPEGFFQLRKELEENPLWIKS